MEGKKQGYAVEFVHRPPKEVQTTCSVCQKVLSQPKMVDCCGVRFCTSCLMDRGEYSYGRPLCPQCRQPFNSMPDKQLERTLNNFEVYCIHQKKGCWWTGNLGSLSEHLNESPRSDWDLFDGCSYQSVKCTRCKSPCQRSLMRNHLEETCSQRDLDCHFRSAGCNVRKPKPELEKHTKEAVVVHLSLVTDHLNKRIDQQEQSIMRSTASSMQSTKRDLEAARDREIQYVQNRVKELKEKQDGLFMCVVCLTGAIVLIICIIVSIFKTLDEKLKS